MNSIEISQHQIDRKWQQVKADVTQRTNEFLSIGRAQGPDINTGLELQLAQLAGREHCTLTACGTDALIIALESLELPPKSKVAVPNITWIATASAVLLAGHLPVVIDVHADYTMDVSALKQANVDAVILVDLHGNSCHWDEIEQLGLTIPVIMDAAQSHNTIYQDRHSFSRGIIACTSFSPVKPLTSFGSGGAVFTNKKELAQQHQDLRLHGKSLKTRPAERLGHNSMMGAFEIASVEACLKHHNNWHKRREKIFKEYVSAVNGKFLTSHSNTMGYQNGCYRFCISVPRTHETVAQAHDQGIDLAFAQANINEEPLFRLSSGGDVTMSIILKQTSLYVPCQHTLTDTEVEKISNFLRSL